MRVIERVRRILAHLTIVLSLAFLTFIVLDFFNPLMAFTSNEVSTPLLGLLCMASLMTGLGALRLHRFSAVSAGGARKGPMVGGRSRALRGPGAQALHAKSNASMPRIQRGPERRS